MSLLSLFNILPRGTLSKNSVRDENNKETVINLCAFFAATKLANDIIIDLITAKTPTITVRIENTIRYFSLF
jgi:hypothetical protein